MSFNFADTFESMINATQAELSAEGGNIQEQIKQILVDEKERLELIAMIKLDPTASDAEFEAALANEKEVMENAALALEILVKAKIQRAINAAIDVLNGALMKAVTGGIL